MLSARNVLLPFVLMIAAIASLAVVSSSRSAIAQPQPSVSPAASKSEEPREGDIDLERSRVYIKVDKTGLGHTHGVEGRFKSGRLDPGASQEAGLMVFDMTTFVADTATARSYVGLEGTTDSATAQKVTANMVGPDVLDVRRYPTATFAIDSVVPAREQPERDGARYVMDGRFTLHGVTHPMQITAVLTKAEDGSQRLRGGFYVNQTSFGIRPYTAALGAVGVADRLTIYGEVWLHGPQPAGRTSR